MLLFEISYEASITIAEHCFLQNHAYYYLVFAITRIAFLNFTTFHTCNSFCLHFASSSFRDSSRIHFA